MGLTVDENIACPICEGEQLKLESDAIRCLTCDHVYAASDGIYWFAEKEYFFGETSRETMRQLLDCIRVSPEAIDKLETTNSIGGVDIGDFLRGYMFSTERTSYIEYLLQHYAAPSIPTSLDIGSGYGQVGSCLEQHGFRNYYVELTPERLQFAGLKNVHRGLSNGVYICGGDRSIPVRRNAIGIATCIGVLEWAPSSIPDRAPRDVQLSFLEQIRERLVPGGYLILGIENRYAYKYLLGYPDDHTGIRFITFLPRFLASLYSRFLGKGEYRNYLYGYRGLKRLIEAAGFTQVDILYPHIDYRFAKHTHKFSDRRAIDLRLSELPSNGVLRRLVASALRLLNGIGLFRYVAYSFIVVARK